MSYNSPISSAKFIFFDKLPSCATITISQFSIVSITTIIEQLQLFPSPSGPFTITPLHSPLPQAQATPFASWLETMLKQFLVLSSESKQTWPVSFPSEEPGVSQWLSSWTKPRVAVIVKLKAGGRERRLWLGTLNCAWTYRPFFPKTTPQWLSPKPVLARTTFLKKHKTQIHRKNDYMPES